MGSEIVRRLETATGPDRELDAEIRRHFGGKPMDPVFCRPLGMMSVETQPFTASLDAAIALVERMLPGEGFILETHGGRNVAGIGTSGKHPSSGATPALALLLTAFRAQERR